jgi:5-(carboxyamino)imidazole ribonucleotide mutase
MTSNSDQPVVGVIMGSRSDWETMQHASEQLDALGVAHETQVVSAHRTPALMHTYAAEAAGRGLRVIIAGAGGAAHLPGMVAGMTTLPVIGVPIQSKALNGLDSLLSIVQMPGGVPCGTMAIGKAGAINAALFAARILGLSDDTIAKAVREQQEAQTRAVLDDPDPTAPATEQRPPS